MVKMSYTPQTPYELWIDGLKPGARVEVRHGFSYAEGTAEVVEPAKGLTQPLLRMVQGSGWWLGKLLRRDGTWQIVGGDRYPWR
jgi:hypothetical protein